MSSLGCGVLRSGICRSWHVMRVCCAVRAREVVQLWLDAGAHLQPPNQASFVRYLMSCPRFDLRKAALRYHPFTPSLRCCVHAHFCKRGGGLLERVVGACVICYRGTLKEKRWIHPADFFIWDRTLPDNGECACMLTFQGLAAGVRLEQKGNVRFRVFGKVMGYRNCYWNDNIERNQPLMLLQYISTFKGYYAFLWPETCDNYVVNMNK